MSDRPRALGKLPPSSTVGGLRQLALIYRRDWEHVDGRYVATLTRKGYVRRLPNGKWELTPIGEIILSEVLALAWCSPRGAPMILSAIAEAAGIPPEKS